MSISAMGLDIQRLASGCGAGYCSMMDDTGWLILTVVGGGVIAMMVRLWHRRWRAGKLADQMLEDVIRRKDAFRR